MSATLPLIGVTMGDPAGVGPELCLRLLHHLPLHSICVPVVYGDAALLLRVARQIGLPPPSAILSLADWNSGASPHVPTVLDIPALTVEVTPGQVSAACGAAAYQYITLAIADALAGKLAAVCTAPIHKEALAAAGIRYPGHTEIFTALTHAPRSCMMLTSPEITCSLVTCHVGYRDVPALLSSQRVTDTIDLTVSALTRLRRRPPRLVVCGLNPHAGEHGLFGDSEEERLILPAVQHARQRGLDIEGPLPPDTAFVPWRRRATDAYICMYHDQGLIPLKALAFDDAVNITLGLPIIRTSVDHGTAFDIAWQGKASPTSLYEALTLATRLLA